MKSFLIAVGMAATVNSAVRTIFDEDAVNNETNGQLVRVNDSTTTSILGDSTMEIHW